MTSSRGDGLAAPGAAGGDPVGAVPWRRAVRDVALVAILAVGAVLGAAILTSALPEEVQRLVFHTPLAIVVLIGVTAWVLWRISARKPPTP